jgi:hypothetical protein
MSRRVTVDWSEETARVWWRFGSGTPAPYPGRRSAFLCMLRQWATDAVRIVARFIYGEDSTEIISADVPRSRPPLPRAPLTRVARPPVMTGAASILAPPVGPTRAVRMTT